jgi:hypothetical protein
VSFELGGVKMYKMPRTNSEAILESRRTRARHEKPKLLRAGARRRQASKKKKKKETRKEDKQRLAGGASERMLNQCVFTCVAAFGRPQPPHELRVLLGWP